MAAGDVGGDVGVTAAQVLHEGVTGEKPPRRTPLQAVHWPEPGLQPPVFCLDRVVRVLPGDVQRRGDHLIEDARVARCAVGRDLGQDRARAAPG